MAEDWADEKARKLVWSQCPNECGSLLGDSCGYCDFWRPRWSALLREVRDEWVREKVEVSEFLLKDRLASKDSEA